jgi:hypothetical protein
MSLVFVVCFVCASLCDELITCSEESDQGCVIVCGCVCVCVCVCVSNYEQSTIKRPTSELDCNATEKESVL